MKRLFVFLMCLSGIFIMFGGFASAADPIVIGVPTSLGYLPGLESFQAAQLAAEEINAQGGVMVGSTRRLIKLESSDIRDAEPGVPVPEALLGIEKLILEKSLSWAWLRMIAGTLE